MTTTTTLYRLYSATWPDFLAALAHLIEKDWVANSDLPVIVRQIAKWNGAG